VRTEAVLKRTYYARTGISRHEAGGTCQTRTACGRRTLDRATGHWAICQDTSLMVSVTKGVELSRSAPPASAVRIMHPMLSALPTFLVVYSLLYAAFVVQSPFLPALLSGRGCTPRKSALSSLPSLRSASLLGLRSVTSLIGCDGTP
jgi:hypothetical protein